MYIRTKMPNSLHMLILIFFTAKANIVPTNLTGTWGGKWFPQNPESTKETNDLDELFKTNNIEKNSKDTWAGKWFPNVPTEETFSTTNSHNMNIHQECDDGKKNINIDFDPEDRRHSYKYLCIDHKSKYEPKFSTHPIKHEYVVPPAYRASSLCLNETIEYEERLPTFGSHRYLYPKYGEYKYLPVQRWMHSLENGAIVMLYHPCANHMQIEKLRNTLNACLYRHVITPSLLLLPERPLALVAWGKSLEMSAVDVFTVVEFIKENANGPRTDVRYDLQEYDVTLLVEAKLVTDESDSQICANINL